MQSPVEQDGATEVVAFRLGLAHKSDVSGLRALLEEGRLSADEVVAVTGKTEGAGGTGDDTRKVLDAALRGLIAERGRRRAPEVARIPMVFSSGGVGLLEPNVVIYGRRPATAAADLSQSRLVVGAAQSPTMPAHLVGRPEMVRAVGSAVAAAAAEAGIPAAEAAYVLAKTKMQPPAEADRVSPDGPGTFTPEYLRGVRKANGATALGIATAVGDVGAVTEADIAENRQLWSARASASSGHEFPESQVILLGNRPGAPGRLRIGRAVLQDALDVGALYRALGDAGLDCGGPQLAAAERARVVAVYVKVDLPAGTLRGHRQVGAESNPHYAAEVKAAVGGTMAAALGMPAIYISGFATHQGPPGGGSVAAVVEVGPAGH